MASGNGAVFRRTVSVAARIALVLLFMGPPAAMADVQDDCRKSCRPECDGFSVNVCKNITSIFPVLNFAYTTCKVRLSAECTHICSLNTLTPGTPLPAPSSSLLSPPCKQNWCMHLLYFKILLLLITLLCNKCLSSRRCSWMISQINRNLIWCQQNMPGTSA